MTVHISAPLLAMAEELFPRLMRNYSLRPDALQILMLAEHATHGVGVLDEGRQALAWAEFEYGLVEEPPVVPKPWWYPGAPTPAAASVAA